MIGINKLVQSNLLNIALLSSFLGIASPVLAESDLSYNAAVVSHYLWRGFDLNNENPALQGGLDYEHDSGFYAGAWASQYEFDEEDDGIEIDIYVGYSLALNDHFSVDASINSYQYTGSTDSSIEWKIGLVHDRFELNYFHDQDLETDYIELNANYPITEQFSANAHYGINDDGDDNYNDYSLFVNYAISDMWEANLGYSNHELDTQFAQGTIFAGVFVYF